MLICISLLSAFELLIMKFWREKEQENKRRLFLSHRLQFSLSMNTRSAHYILCNHVSCLLIRASCHLGLSHGLLLAATTTVSRSMINHGVILGNCCLKLGKPCTRFASFGLMEQIWFSSLISFFTLQQGYKSRWNLCTCLDWLWECLCCSRRGWSSNVSIPHCCSFIPRVIWTRTSSPLLVENNIIFLHHVVIEECMFLARYVLLLGCLCSKKIF